MEPASYLCVTPYGLTSVTALGVTTIGAGWRSSIEIERFSYWWFPPNYLRPYLYDGFALEFECVRASDGTRRLAPVGGYKAFIPRAFSAGLAILLHKRSIDFAAWKGYSRQHLIFQIVRRMHVHLDRNFDSAHDLYVRARGRGGEIGRNLLPEDLAFDGSQRGPVPAEVLIGVGRDLAKAEGIVKPDEKTAIQYGLFELARRNPLRMPDQNTSALLRLALFDAAAGETPDRKSLKLVSKRIDQWLDDHGQDSTERFNDSFFPGRSNFIKAIADQRNLPGGMLEHALVRQAILQLGWEAYDIVGRCIEAFMRQVVKCLPQPVVPAERRLIREMYFRRPYFGGLSLMLFAERGSFVKKAITELWRQPGDELLVGTLHRLLEIYGQLVLKRREADRRSKQKSEHRKSPAVEVSGTDALADALASPERTSIYEEIARYLAERDGLHCSNCRGHWTSHLAGNLPDGVLPDPVALMVRCECEQVAKECPLSLDEFTALAAQFMEDGD